MRWCASTTSDGQTRASGPPVEVTDLPSAINHHWTKALTASADGRFLYVGIGSNSNITERGMTAEADRAMVWQVDAQTGAHRPYATGLRNPTALTIQPGTGQLWAVVNERDEIGPNLVPDYLTVRARRRLSTAGPTAIGARTSTRACGRRIRRRSPRRSRPDYGLGSHVAALGVAFSTPAMGARFADGVFVGEHGSWNRSVAVGYRCLRAVPRRPPGGSADRLRDRLPGQDGKTRGRPVGVTRGSARRTDRRRRSFEHDLARGTSAAAGLGRDGLAFERGAVPARQVRGRVVGRLEELAEHGRRVGRGAHFGIGQHNSP